MLNSARKKASKAGFKNIELVEGDAAKISFPKNYFDGVISTIGISSIPNHKEALRRVMGNLKKNKRLVILDGKLFNPPLKMFNPFIKYLRWSKSWDVNKDIINDVKKLFKNAHIEEFLCGLFFIITCIKKD
ncbi:MAG: class I SAM-dependent methyltransferase [Nanoarchaeota archaeon]|nr:class I SAM-dependent methyltransferase [Nanoarchaeota archaeon]MBU1004377.1 class I SAM-dependent methyltransferase [Nanoarchaeota archaeon]